MSIFMLLTLQSVPTVKLLSVQYSVLGVKGGVKDAGVKVFSYRADKVELHDKKNTQ